MAWCLVKHRDNFAFTFITVLIQAATKIRSYGEKLTASAFLQMLQSILRTS